MNRALPSPLLRCTALTLCLLFATQDAFTWGPRARRAVAAAAISQLRGDLGDVFIVGESNYESDLIRGAVDGLDVLRNFAALETESQAIDAVMNQIDLLSEVRKRGVGSYFAFRMGALSALIAQVVLPYGFPQTPEERELYARITADLERHVQEYEFDPFKSPLGFVENGESYFRKKRPFIEDDRRMIREEYNRGRGYEGFLDDAGSAYFQRSVEAVADAWNTIMVVNDSMRRRTPPGTKLADYYIDEIRYQLEVKDNPEGADRAYRDFAQVNQNNMANFIKVGDLYYAYGTEESRERAVHEWKIAQRQPGVHARDAARRISRHYLQLGEALFARAQTLEAEDTDLEDARRAFQTALEFDGTSERAANLVSQSTAAINERRELYDQQQAFIDSAITIRENAEQSLLNQDYRDALGSFQQALNLVVEVGPEFADLQETAKDLASDLRKSIKTSISEMFDEANERIQEGDQLANEGKYEDAINMYRTVEVLLEDLPEEEDSIDTQRKIDMLDLVATKIEDAEVRMKNQPAGRRTRS